MTLRVALPDTALIDCTDLRQKTIKIGQIARCAAVFCVEEIVIFTTDIDYQKKERDISLMTKILRYMDTPQYLRKQVFSRAPALKYAGLLPPLRIPSHPLNPSIEQLTDGELRWGVPVREGIIDIGVNETIGYSDSLKGKGPFIFRIEKDGEHIKLRKIDRKNVETYFGFEVSTSRNFTEFLGNPSLGTRVAFSRLGVPFKNIEKGLVASVTSTKSLLAVFGGPKRGLRDLFPKNARLKNSIDFWINTIPGQGTETVRLEEAITVSLALINMALGSHIVKLGFY